MFIVPNFFYNDVVTSSQVLLAVENRVLLPPTNFAVE